MPDQNLTLRDVLPENLKSNYPDEVLATSMEEAYNIAVYDQPPTSALSKDDINDIVEIYELYQNKGQNGQSNGSSPAYWEKSEEENKAYWEKQS